MIKKTTSNQSCGRDRVCKKMRFTAPQYMNVNTLQSRKVEVLRNIGLFRIIGVSSYRKVDLNI